MCGKQTRHRLLRVIFFSIYLCAPQSLALLKSAFPCLLKEGTIRGPIKLITKAVPPNSGGDKPHIQSINVHTSACTPSTHKQQHTDATPPSAGEDVVHPGLQMDPLVPSEGVLLIEFSLEGDEDLLWRLKCVHSPTFGQLMHGHQTAKVCM